MIPEQLSPVFGMIKALCNNDKTLEDYLINWMARTVQTTIDDSPLTMRNDKAIVSNSKHTIEFFEWFGGVLALRPNGSNSYIRTTAKAIVDNSSILEGKTLAIIDDADDYMDVLNELVIAETIISVRPDKSLVGVKNNCNFVFIVSDMSKVKK